MKRRARTALGSIATTHAEAARRLFPAVIDESAQAQRKVLSNHCALAFDSLMAAQATLAVAYRERKTAKERESQLERDAVRAIENARKLFLGNCSKGT